MGNLLDIIIVLSNNIITWGVINLGVSMLKEGSIRLTRVCPVQE